MVARKSSRVKKSPVVYQAPEAVPRTVRAPSTPKQAVVNRRIFGKDVDLQMECVEDELSPAQVKALKEAQQEHDKANEMIKEVRAGNILVPSSQPNTFTIVPPKPPQPPPQLTPPPVPQQQAPPIQLQKLPSPLEEAGSQRGLPPPRPAQFLNKQMQEISKSQGTRAPEVLFISDNSAMTGGPKLTTQTLLGTQISTQPLQFQQMTIAGHQVTMSGGAGVMPQQVYKFVSLPSNMQPNIVQNQWALRPLLTVSPQQQQQLSLVGSNQQGVPQFATMTLTQQPAPRTLPARPAQVSVPSKISKIDTAAKRPAPPDVAVVEPPAKKRAGKEEVQDDTGNWVPLDEYYYGTHEGDPSYTEEKGEYRFKCWYCSKMLYNNVRAMQHIQGHIDASKQQNIDLSDLTQCKHCYKQFDTPFEMQTHVEKVHLSNKVLMCRICERDFTTPRELTQHMKGNHHACEMPYVCHLCNFRSSMYSDVVDHFKKRHDSSHFMLCLYCLRTFEVKFVSQGWGQTQTYYGHLLKHQTKSSTKKCVVCRLTFFNAIDVKTHRKNCHVGNHLDVKVSPHSGKSEAGSSKKRASQLKSLNAPSVSRIQDYGTVVFPDETNTAKCIECKMIMSSTDHYKKYVHCTMCRFATSCSVAYAKHMMGFHSGQMTSLNMNIPWERPMKDIMYCVCGFKSAYGNKVANHLVYCGKWTCYSTQIQAADQTAPSKVEEKTEGSLLGMLGLVSKDQVIPKIISSKPRPKCKTKPAVGTSETKAITVDTEEVTTQKTKPAVGKKQIKANTEEITEDKANIHEEESKSSENPPKEEDKKGQEENKQILETKLKEPSDEQPSRSVENDKAELNEDKSEEDNSPTEVVETVKNFEENEKKVLEVKEEATRETKKEDKPQGMEKEETKTEQKDQTASLEVNIMVFKTSGKDQDSEPKPEMKTISEEQMEIGDGDSGGKKESDEMFQEKKEELEISTDNEDKNENENAKVADEETIKEQDTEQEEDKDKKVHDVAEDTGVENMEEDKSEEKSESSQTNEESGKVGGQESESREENKQDSMMAEDSSETTEDKSKEKQDSSISAETEPETSGKDQAEDLDHRESQTRDRQSSERDRQSRERDRHSSERDRHNSAGRHEERHHHDDRQHHDNRSHGSNRSDSHHSNRPYEQNRDRDRSSDRDYNRNQGYRQGDNRGGYSGYQDNRGQGYGGGGNYRGQGGQYGGYHGNRGSHYQDRNRGGNQQGNFNRNYQNRGGYNQNYRGGGYGGGYY